MPDNEPAHDIDLLGQHVRYPANWFAVAAVLVVCFALVGITWVVLVAAKRDNLEVVGGVVTSYRISPKGAKEIQAGPVRYGFWTPSSRTWSGEQRSKVPENDQWEVLDNESRVEAFGELLGQNEAVQGFRRYEVVGRGRGELKSGWWWIVTVSPDYKVEDFGKTYRTFWKARDDIYLEVTGGDGK